MKTVLVLGAGRSSSALIAYLLKSSRRSDWHIIVGDKIKVAAENAINENGGGEAIQFDAGDEQASLDVIKSADVVISLLPPALHSVVAQMCITVGRHLLTASYVSDTMKNFDVVAKSKGLLFLNECGLDPGIDHMSAMQMIDNIRSNDGKVTSFESFTGGLIAPETAPDNPWRYKFTWNPYNVVTAGKDGAVYLKDNEQKCIPYKNIFSEITAVNVPGLGEFEGYPNRDSLKYIELYGLSNAETMLRGTLRSKGFCSAWNVLVRLGCCDEHCGMNTEHMTHYDFLNAFVNAGLGQSLEEELMRKISMSTNDQYCIRWSGFFDKELVGMRNGTPAQILEHILMKKWKLNTDDKDMIVMWHRLRFEQSGKESEMQSGLVVKGEDSRNTAMAKTVGLPLGIVARLLLEERISQRGVCIPVGKEFYEPVLKELDTLGVRFKEQIS